MSVNEKENDVEYDTFVANRMYLDQFRKSLYGMSDATIRKHVKNITVFLRDFLEVEHLRADEAVEQDPYFFFNYLIEKDVADSPEEMDSFAASIRKFYRFMQDDGKISDRQYKKLSRAIKDGMPEWHNTLKAKMDGGNLFLNEEENNEEESDEDPGCTPVILRYARVKDGVVDYDGAYNSRGDIVDFSGFTGFVDEANTDEDCIYIDFDAKSLKRIPFGYMCYCAEEIYTVFGYYFDPDDVEILFEKEISSQEDLDECFKQIESLCEGLSRGTAL